MKNLYDLSIKEKNINPNIDLSQDTQYVIRFLENLKHIKKFSERTVINYTVDMRQYLNYLSTKCLHCTEVDKKFLRRYISFMRKEGFEVKSIHRKISSIKSFYKYMTRKEIIDNNPATTLPYPKLEKKLPTILSVTEVEKLLDEFIPTTEKEYRDKCIIEMLYSTGMRVSELTGINVNEIDMISKYVKVTGKGNKERIVFLNNRVIPTIRDYVEARKKILSSNKANKSSVSKIDEYKNSEEALFITRTGNRIHPTTVYQIVKLYSKNIVSGKSITPHTFRHSFATHIMNKGADIRVVQELLGHESISTTQNYTHVSKERLRDTYRKFHPHGKK